MQTRWRPELSSESNKLLRHKRQPKYQSWSAMYKHVSTAMLLKSFLFLTNYDLFFFRIHYSPFIATIQSDINLKPPKTSERNVLWKTNRNISISFKYLCSFYQNSFRTLSELFHRKTKAAISKITGTMQIIISWLIIKSTKLVIKLMKVNDCV